jgi:hypothetical protein
MSEYDVKFTDGMMGKYAVNVIADNMYAQVDNKGNMFHFLLFLFLEEYLDDTSYLYFTGREWCRDGALLFGMHLQGSAQVMSIEFFCM